jgi:hypothetical protein
MGGRHGLRTRSSDCHLEPSRSGVVRRVGYANTAGGMGDLPSHALFTREHRGPDDLDVIEALRKA